MKYERLTPKTLLSDVLKEYRICCVGEPIIGTFGGRDIVELIDRLVEIEDKIESGEIDYVSDKDKEIARLIAENQRLREEAAEQKSIAAHEHATQMEWFQIACDYKAENAELRARLDKAVELPRVECIKTREWLNRERVGDIMFEWCVLYKKGGWFVVEPCLSKEAAEARFKELQGGEMFREGL